MARPCKQRFIGTLPRASMFRPHGVPCEYSARVTLSLDEIEAIRLADLEGNEHEQAATQMNVSRPTFGRILERAHRTVAEALVHGKILQIAGGPVTAARRGTVRCPHCRRMWQVPVPAAASFRCPRCPVER